MRPSCPTSCDEPPPEIARRTRRLRCDPDEVAASSRSGTMVGTMTGPDVKTDSLLARAIDVARAAAVDVGGDAVGEHLGVHAEAERVVTHAFASTLPGYSGWYWAVTLARPPRGKVADRRRGRAAARRGRAARPGLGAVGRAGAPGDLSPGDLLPGDPGDPRLVPAYLRQRRPGGRGGRVRARARPGAGDVARRPPGRRRALAGRRRRPGRPDGPAGARALRHLRFPAAAGRAALGRASACAATR